MLVPRGRFFAFIAEVMEELEELLRHVVLLGVDTDESPDTVMMLLPGRMAEKEVGEFVTKLGGGAVVSEDGEDIPRC
jgi:hypothetical protein